VRIPVKTCTPEDLVQAVRVAAAGDAILSPSVTRRLIAEYAHRSKPPHAARKSKDDLTEREREIVTLVGQGLTNEQIATKLYLSVATVRTHVGRAMTKLSAGHRAQLVTFAYETGLVAAGWEPDRR
jgi:DNA-binding NarL/FixJ family response regulator